VPNFSVPAENLNLFGKDIGPVIIPMSYDISWRILLHLGQFVSTKKFLDFFTGRDAANIRLPGNKNDLEIIITKRQISSETDDIIVEARLCREPLEIIFSDQHKRIEAILLNSPELQGRKIELYDSDNIEFVISPLKSSQLGACLISSNLQVSSEDALKSLQEFICFFTFVKGTHCGSGNIFSFDENNDVSMQLLGFTRSDSTATQTNWFDSSIIPKLPEIYLLFSSAMKYAETAQAMNQTIDFYRASNASRHVSLEMSIIAAHSALEASVNYILTHRAGWSKNLIDNRSISFSEKMRAASAFFGVNDEFLKNSPEISKVAKERGFDVFEIISFYRNKLVHQDQKFIPTGIQLHETWLLAQWFVEIFLFCIIGFQGEIIDRRVYTGWRGTKYIVASRK
jgi:hypothetical protein